jgi:hypothetical protein
LRDHTRGFQEVKKDDFVKSPDAQVELHPSSLWRTPKVRLTPHDLCALPAELFTQPSNLDNFLTFYEFIKKEVHPVDAYFLLPQASGDFDKPTSFQSEMNDDHCFTNLIILGLPSFNHTLQAL